MKRGDSSWPPPPSDGARSQDTRNIVVAVVVSVVILLAFDFWFARPQREAARLAAPLVSTFPSDVASGAADADSDFAAPSLGLQGDALGNAVPVADAAGEAERAQEEEAGERIGVEGDGVSGSLLLRGARLDDLSLTDYRETTAPDSPLIRLLSPRDGPRPFFASFGWAAGKGAVPNESSLWSTEAGARARLEAGEVITLSWDNDENLRFEQEWRLDERFLFQVVQRVHNYSDEAVELAPWGLLGRADPPPGLGYYILHEGPIGWLEDSLHEVDYDDLVARGTPLAFEAADGDWLGFTDKYWMAAIAGGTGGGGKARLFRLGANAEGQAGRFQADFLGATATAQARGSFTAPPMYLFAGAKEVQLLDAYEADHGINRFDLAVDFGWLYFLTKPFFLGLDAIFRFTGNFGVAILLFTVLIRLAFFPLANRSFRTMAKMRTIQPQMLEIRERCGKDRTQLQKEVMLLYKREKVSPLSGCLPVVLQIPVFFALYKVLFVTIEMRHAPFFGWITDLSAPDPTTWFNLFGLLPFARPELGLLNALQIGIWPLAMGITMGLQMRLNPPPPDPIQARIFAWMPVFFTFFLASFPAGLVVYWTCNNMLSMSQQAFILHRSGVPVRFHTRVKPPADKSGDKGGDKSGGDKSGGDKSGGDKPSAKKS